MKPLRHAGFVLALLFPLLASAHPGHGGHELEWDFTAGFGHPLTGLDHLLALLAAGIWAARQADRRLAWLVPAGFAGFLALGALLGQRGAVVPGLESLVAASVLALGLMIAAVRQLPTGAALGLLAAFAFLHGQAHGAEIPRSTDGLAYGAGFVAASLAVSLAGAAAVRAIAATRPGVLRWVGWAIAAGGVALLAT